MPESPVLALHVPLVIAPPAIVPSMMPVTPFGSGPTSKWTDVPVTGSAAERGQAGEIRRHDWRSYRRS